MNLQKPIRPLLPSVRSKAEYASLLANDLSLIGMFPRANVPQEKGISSSVFLDALPETIRKKYIRDPDSVFVYLHSDERLTEDEKEHIRDILWNMPKKKKGENGDEQVWWGKYPIEAFMYGVSEQTMNMFQVVRADIEGLCERTDELQEGMNKTNAELFHLTLSEDTPIAKQMEQIVGRLEQQEKEIERIKQNKLFQCCLPWC
jgi:hypothetical protein